MGAGVRDRDELPARVHGAAAAQGREATTSDRRSEILSFAADHDSFDRLLPDQKMESYFTVVGAEGDGVIAGKGKLTVRDQAYE